MKTLTLFIGIILVLAVAGGFVYLNGNSSPTGNVVNSGSGDSQNIVLSFKNGNYAPNTITVKAGQPVKISLDSSIKGCYRSFTIKSFGVSKYLATPSDSVEFTPTQKGTFSFACSMGMGFGKLVVE